MTPRAAGLKVAHHAARHIKKRRSNTMTKGAEMATAMSNFVNSFSPDTKGFISTMATEHRTLQQSFTRLCFEWIQQTAKNSYDGRNEASVLLCREIVEKMTVDGICKLYVPYI